MALKEYVWRDSTYLFDEEKAPADAVPVKVKQTRRKTVSDKSATPKTK